MDGAAGGAARRSRRARRRSRCSRAVRTRTGTRRPAQICPAEQGMPQAPQFVGSVGDVDAPVAAGGLVGGADRGRSSDAPVLVQAAARRRQASSARRERDRDVAVVRHRERTRARVTQRRRLPPAEAGHRRDEPERCRAVPDVPPPSPTSHAQPPPPAAPGDPPAPGPPVVAGRRSATPVPPCPCVEPPVPAPSRVGPDPCRRCR